ncbi:hypothetical protein LJC16_03340 [Bacteroidales bacterium OttesenSCG-928-C19]|nr:hypothetical protein [Bacteroidales bacterium OttesenSCG-928-C19]
MFLELISELPPPSCPQLEDLNYDTSLYLDVLSNYKNDLEKHLNDTLEVFIAIYDSLFTYDFDDIKYVQLSKEYNTILESIAENPKKSVWIDINKIENTGRYRLLHLSSFSNSFENTDMWHQEYDFDFRGAIYISRIYFDLEEQYGLFYFSYIRGKNSGDGGVICIKKENDKWLIDNYIGLWVS